MRTVIIVLAFSLCSYSSANGHDTFASHRYVYGRDVKYRPENVTFERLSVEESVGQIFLMRGGITGGLQIDPAARVPIRRIIRNPNLKEYHRAAIGKLMLEGDVQDVQLLAEYVESRRGKEFGVLVPTTVMSIFRTLATMANRRVDGADELLPKMCVRDYWKGFPFENSNEWAFSDEVLIGAISNLARTQCKELNKLIRQAIDDTPEGPRREGIKWYLEEPRLAECVIEFDWCIFPQIPSFARKHALSNFNGDLENPGPRKVDR